MFQWTVIKFPRRNHFIKIKNKIRSYMMSLKNVVNHKWVWITLCVITLHFNPIFGQDLVYSQFNSMPLLLNPAFAGNNSCNYRVSAIGRSQWMGVENVKSYKSATIAGDFNIGNNTDEKLNLWGFGVVGSFDKSGNGNYTNLSFLTNIAYHLRFGSEGQNFLSFGIQGGIGQRSVNSSNLIFNDQLDHLGRNTFSSTDALVNDSKLYPDINFGSLLTLNPSVASNIYIGASMFHALSPDISFTNNEYKLAPRYNFHGGGNFALGNLYLLPSAYYQYQQLSNWNVGTYLGKTLMAGNQETASIVGYLGAWLKSSDAIAAAARLDFSSFSVVFSYDIHTGGVSKNLSSVGSPEFSINYYGCFARNSKRMGCPSL